jgi:aminoglycoside phosphotransferase (APT) family kinase protein
MGEGEALASVVRMVRTLHDLTAGTELALDDDVVCHGDVAPRNLVWRGHRAVCLLDWDLAGPGPRVKDVALMARRLLSLGPTGPAPATQGRRLRRLLDLYGLEERDGFVQRIIEYQADMIAAIARVAADGDVVYRGMLARWRAHQQDNAAVVLAWLVEHAGELDSAMD